MTTILFLTQRMSLGFGVSVLVHNLSVELLKLGYRVVVGCLEADPDPMPYEIAILAPTPEDVRRLCEELGAPIVIAQTSPFFELAAPLSPRFECWTWENGDPTPSLFPADGAERERIKLNKQLHCYPRTRGVFVISDFLRGDVGREDAQVIYIGCDHAPDLGSKGFQAFSVDPQRPLRVGTLMRLGPGEAFYKGNQLFVDFVGRLKELKINVEPWVMGRGTQLEADLFERNGIRVLLNGSESQKWEYLRGLDLFISCSLWEGFNLPLAEAQALGTAAMAFDVGAHPEVTPLVLSGLEEAVALTEACANDRQLLSDLSRTCYQFVRSRFLWRNTAWQLHLTLSGVAGRQGTLLARSSTVGLGWRRRPVFQVLFRAVEFWRKNGAVATVRKITRFIRDRL